MTVDEREVPSALRDLVQAKRRELVEAVANVDEVLGEMFLSDQTPSPEELTVTIIMIMIHVHYVHQLCSLPLIKLKQCSL